MIEFSKGLAVTQLTLMSSKPPADFEGVTLLPVEGTWCACLGARTTLRVASWSFNVQTCVYGDSPCASRTLCKRVACALNRPGH